MTFTSLLGSPVRGGSGASGQHAVPGHLTTDQFPADPVLFPSRCPSPCLMAAHIAKWKQEEDKHISRENLSGMDEKTDSAQRESVPIFVYQVAKPLTQKDWWSSCRGTSSFSSSGSEQQISCFGFIVVWGLWVSLWDQHSKQARDSEWTSAGINDFLWASTAHLVLLNAYPNWAIFLQRRERSFIQANLFSSTISDHILI